MSKTGLALWLILILPPTIPLYAADENEDLADDEPPSVSKNVQWSNGDRYYGDYVDNQRTGKGTYIWANGDRYEGEFYEGMRDGRGKYIWANGDRYEGDYMENQRDGEGTYIWANGDRFQGEFYEGKRGEGKIIRAKKPVPLVSPLPSEKKTLIIDLENKETIKAERLESNLEETKEQISLEQVTITQLEKETETTDIQNDDSDNVKENIPSDSTNGRMTIRWPNGDFYEGEYSGGKRTGQGVYIWTNGDHYKGDFVDGERYGFGTYTWANGDHYEGEYIEDQRHGKGLYVWANGDRYSGSFSKGQRHGYGTLTWVEGDTYKGDFVEGKRTGKGIYISSGGDRYEGSFEEGKRTGKGILISANGDPNQIEFQENLYTFEELEFEGGKLVSATTTGEREDDTHNDVDEEEGDNG